MKPGVRDPRTLGKPPARLPVRRDARLWYLFWDARSQSISATPKSERLRFLPFSTTMSGFDADDPRSTRFEGELYVRESMLAQTADHSGQRSWGSYPGARHHLSMATFDSLAPAKCGPGSPKVVYNPNAFRLHRTPQALFSTPAPTDDQVHEMPEPPLVTTIADKPPDFTTAPRCPGPFGPPRVNDARRKASSISLKTIGKGDVKGGRSYRPK